MTELALVCGNYVFVRGASIFSMPVFAIKTKLKALFCNDVMKNTCKKHSYALIFKKEGVNLQPIKTKIKES